jgi:YD repeat-containing protein
MDSLRQAANSPAGQAGKILRCGNAVFRARCWSFRGLSIAVLWVALIPAAVFADSQRVLRYEYDGAGNIVRIVAADNLALATVDALNPGFIDQGAQVDIVASGTNLAGAEVSTTALGLIVLGVVPISDTQVSFTLQADALTPLGLAELEFTTALGSTTAVVLVAEPLPIIASIPNPIALSVAAPPAPVVLVFEAPFSEARTFQLAVQNPAIATVSETSIVMPGGDVQVTVTLDGLLAGVTTLDVTEPQRFRAVSVPVFISATGLAAGTYAVESPGVGVAVYTPSASPHDSDVMSQAVGVAVYAPAARVLSADQPSAVVGASLGPVADSVLPVSIGRGAAATLTLSGSGLDEVSAVQFVPDDGVTVSGPLVPSLEGSELQVSVTVSPSAALSSRAITLTGPQGIGTPNVELEITP